MVGSMREVVTRGLAHLEQGELVHMSRNEIRDENLVALAHFGEE